MWTEALEAKFVNGKPFGRKEFDNLLGKWGATTDQPVSFQAEDILEAYPDAKVILVERDVDRWYKSFCEGVIDSNNNPFIPLASIIDRTYLGQMRAQMDLIGKYYLGVQGKRTKYGLINNPDYFDAWKANAKSIYRAHNEKIKRIVPKERFLLFQLDQGWQPLCEFLNRPIPDVPFPRVNETAAVQEKVNLYIAQSYKRTLIKFARRSTPFLAILLADLIWRYFR
jgi:hypothetical protein